MPFSIVPRLAGTLALPDAADENLSGEDVVHGMLRRQHLVTLHAFEADDDTQRQILFKNTAPYSLRLVTCELTPDAAVTADNTNYSVISVYHTDTPASGTDKLAAQATTEITGLDDLVAETPVNITLSATNANRIIAPDEYAVLLLDGTNGLGVDLPIGTMLLEWEIVP